MSCETVANQLDELAISLRKHQNSLTSANFEKPLATFQKAIEKLSSTISVIIEAQEQGPEIEALNQRLTSPAAKLLHQEEAFAAFTKAVLGKKFAIKKTESLYHASSRFTEHLLKHRLAKRAVKQFDLMVHEANRPEVDSTDENQLLREIRYIGSLDEDALELAFATRYRNEKLVRKLAEAAHLKLTPKIKFAGIVKKLIPYARNTFANTSF
jgi:hypothetical protein